MRLLVFLALFGLTPVWATEDGCCCGTSEPVCNMTIESRSPLTISEVRELLGLHPVVRSAPALCAASDTADDCACWKPLDTPSKLQVAAFRHDFEPQAALGVEPVYVVFKPLRPSRTVAVTAPPWRPPIPERPGWSHALYPVPPPFLA